MLYRSVPEIVMLIAAQEEKRSSQFVSNCESHVDAASFRCLHSKVPEPLHPLHVPIQVELSTKV